MTVGDYYQPSRSPKHEWLARIEGQSNFLSLLAGIEAGPDTTEPMAALAFSKSRGSIPEFLEAHVAKSSLYKLPIMSAVFMLLVREWHPPEKDWPWIQGAVADAFLDMRDGPKAVKPIKSRARRFRVDVVVYGAMRKAAAKLMDDFLTDARAKYYAAMRPMPESPGIRQNTDRKGGEFPEFYWTRSAMQGMGHFRALPLSSSWDSDDDDDDDCDQQFTPNDFLFRENNGWVEANAKPGPVLTLYGEEAEEHRRKHPAHSKRPHSL